MATKRHNTDNVVIRSIIVGLLNEMNSKIYITNVMGGDVADVRVNVPFYYSFSSDERFWQDYFEEWSDCTQFIEGNYDPIPRGSILLNTVNIVVANQTSRFARAYYSKEEAGELIEYNSYLNSLPLNLTFDCTVTTDTMNDALKITQQVMKIFWRVATFYVMFEGVQIPCQAGFSETYTTDKVVSYTYGDMNKITTKFVIEVEGYFPIFDEKQEMFGGDQIGEFMINFDTTPSTATSSVDTTINLDGNQSGALTTPISEDKMNSKLSEGYYEINPLPKMD